MSEIENKTQEKRRLAKEEEAKNKRKSTWLKIGAVVFVLVFAFLAVYESSFIARVLPAAEVKDTKYTVAEYNWLYTTSYYEIYNNIYQQYGNYASMILDTSKSLKKQKFSEEQTWADYIKDYTDKTLITMTALYDEAKANEYVLPDSYTDSMTQELANMEASAKENGVTVDSLLATNYGRGVNKKVYEEMYLRYVYAYAYGDSVNEGFDITPEEIDARYNEDKTVYDRVTYKYYLIEKESKEGVSDEQAMADAKAKAEAALAAEDTEAYVSSELGAAMSEARYAGHSGINSAFADWLFEDSRKEGDKDVFEGTNGYYVVIFERKEDLHYNMVSVRHILVKPKDTSSDASWDEAYKKAEEYLNTAKSLGGSAENFGYVAMAYSEDSGSKANGGLYSNIAKGQMVQEFEDWCFDPARKEGDTDIIKTQYGWHIMYFVSTDEEYYTYAVDSDIRGEKYSEYLEGIKADYSLKDGSGKFMVGSHT